MARLVYDEGIELYHYISTYCHGAHFTDIQLRVPHAVHNRRFVAFVMREFKLEPDAPFVQELERVHPPDHDPLVDSELKDGFAAFMRRTGLAVLHEHGGNLVIARCAKCNAVLRTPKARQCVWCGHSWFHAA
jgi:hypothetical protein